MKGYILLFFYCLLIVSCNVHPEKYIYFQHKYGDRDEIISDSVSNTTSIHTIFQPDDLVAISVSSIDPEAVKPFATDMTAKGESSKGDNAAGYLIDANGNIDFPLIGTVKIAGLNRIEAALVLKERIKSYVKSPIVNVRLQNFKITILGEVNKPGVFTMNHERITIPEALGLAGDLSINGVRQNVLLIREENGIKKEIRIDLTSRDIFRSPYYYLHQNDIIYVEPFKSKIAASQQVTAYGSLVITGTTLFITILNYLTR
jgi:polysaccharide export outer membrane protein